MQQFLIKAILVCLVGGALGITLSFAIDLLVQLLLPGWQISFPPTALLSAFVYSTGIDVVFGYLPARNAARLNPIDALAREMNKNASHTGLAFYRVLLHNNSVEGA